MNFNCRLLVLILLFFVLSCAPNKNYEYTEEKGKLGFFGAEINFVCLDDKPDCRSPEITEGEL